MLINLGRIHRGLWAAILTLALCAVASTSSAAEPNEGTKGQPVHQKRPQAFDRLSLLKKGYQGGFFSVEDVSETSTDQAKGAPVPDPKATQKKGPIFVSSDPSSHLVPPDQDPRIRINPEAPGPFIGMVTAYQDGDVALAERYADQWVRYQMNFFFEVRELTQLIGEALVRQQVIDEDSWDGVGQMIDYEFAKTRQETGAVLKPQYERALARIKPDPKGQIEVYYFFTLNCSWCRHMAPDVERLWRATGKDPKVKMTALLMDQVPQAWVDEYRNYTGMTMPILSGPEVAKAFNIRFVPAVIVVTPNNGKAYLKTGEQDFGRLYEFIRRAQGLPATLTPEIQQIASVPIGEQEKTRGSMNVAREGAPQGNAMTVGLKFPDAPRGSRQVERFELGKF